MRHKTAGLENARQVSMESEQMLFMYRKMDNRLLAE